MIVDIESHMLVKVCDKSEVTSNDEILSLFGPLGLTFDFDF